MNKLILFLAALFQVTGVLANCEDTTKHLERYADFPKFIRTLNEFDLPEDEAYMRSAFDKIPFAEFDEVWAKADAILDMTKKRNNMELKEEERKAAGVWLNENIRWRDVRKERELSYESRNFLENIYRISEKVFVKRRLAEVSVKLGHADALYEKEMPFMYRVMRHIHSYDSQVGAIRAMTAGLTTSLVLVSFVARAHIETAWTLAGISSAATAAAFLGPPILRRLYRIYPNFAFYYLQSAFSEAGDEGALQMKLEDFLKRAENDRLPESWQQWLVDTASHYHHQKALYDLYNWRLFQLKEPKR